MSSNRSAGDVNAALAAPLYAVALMLVGIPCLDFILSVGMPQLGNLQWRFATVGLLSSILLTPMLGISLAMVVAGQRGHIVWLRILALVALLAALTLVMLVISFGLDVVQLRKAIPEAGQRAFRAASLKALIKHVSAAGVLAFLGLRAWRVSAWRAPATERRPVPLVSR